MVGIGVPMADEDVVTGAVDDVVLAVVARTTARKKLRALLVMAFCCTAMVALEDAGTVVDDACCWEPGG